MKTVTRPKMRVRPIGQKDVDSYKRSQDILELIRISDSFCETNGYTYLEPIYKCVELPDIRKDNTNSTVIDRVRKFDSRKHKDKETIYYEAHLIKIS